MIYKLVTHNKQEHWAALNGMNLYLALWDLDQWFRDKLKYDQSLSVDEREAYQTARDQLYAAMDIRGVDFDHVS